MSLSAASINWWPAVLLAVLLSPEDEDRALQEGQWVSPTPPAAVDPAHVTRAASSLALSVP